MGMQEHLTLNNISSSQNILDYFSSSCEGWARIRLWLQSWALKTVIIFYHNRVPPPLNRRFFMAGDPLGV